MNETKKIKFPVAAIFCTANVLLGLISIFMTYASLPHMPWNRLLNTLLLPILSLISGIVLAAVLLLRRQRRHGIALSCALVLDLAACNLLLKPLVGRLRPFTVQAVELLIPPPGDFSFPSGHTAVSFAAVFALKASGSPLWKPALAMALVLAFSRLYLYVHWPSDVLGGAVLGAAVGWAGARLARRLFPKTA